METFDETPPNQLCKKVDQIINSIRNPTPPPPEKQPFLTSPNEHFIYDRVPVDYPKELYDLSHEGSVVSGWIPEISSFWAGNVNSIFLFSWDLTYFQKYPTPSAVVCAGYLDGYILVVFKKGISIFSYPDFKPLQNKYSVPDNVVTTAIEQGIAGCSDGVLRKITINPKRESVTVSGSFFPTLKEDDPVTQIIKTQSYYVALTLNSHIHLYASPKLKKLASLTSIENIINVWSPEADKILVLDNNAVLYTLKYKMYKITIEDECQLITRRQLQTAFYDHGILVAVDSDRAAFDTIFTARFGGFPVFTLNRSLGSVHSIGSTPTDIKIFCSSGIYSVFEKGRHDESEEIWRFCNAIDPYWTIPIMDVGDDNSLVDQLKEFFHSDYEFLSSLSKYVLTIMDDIRVINGTKSEQYFANKLLSDFFIADRDKRFSELRLISFDIRNKNQLEFGNPPEEIQNLFDKAKCGNNEAALEAVSIITSYKTLPTCFPSLCQFMLQFGFYRELLECVIQWANSVLSDQDALSFENANFPWRDEKMIYSYHLRLGVYKQLIPFLQIAVGQSPSKSEDGIQAVINENKAVADLKYALDFSNEVFHRFVLEFLEKNCHPRKICQFIYSGMINDMKNIRSRHLPAVLLEKGYKKNAFDIYVDRACLDINDTKSKIEFETEDENENVDANSVDERIKYLELAVGLFPDDENANKLLKCARILRPFLIEHPDVEQNLFALDFFDIKETLMNYQEYKMALDVMELYKEKRFDVLNCFLSECDKDEVKYFVHNNSIFSQSEIAHSIYELMHKEGFDFMFDCDIDNLYIFRVLCELWRSGKYHNDVDFIKKVLNRAGKINREIRQEMADVLCEIVLELDSENKLDEASVIRKNLENCFLEQSFNDINDL